MQKTYKIPSLKLPFIPLIFTFFAAVTFLVYFYLKNIGLDGWPGLIILFLIWFGLFYSIIVYFQTRNDDLSVDDNGLKLRYKKALLYFNWDEINKIGFQTISSKRMGVQETTPYLAIRLNDSTKLQTLKISIQNYLENKSIYTQLEPLTKT